MTYMACAREREWLADYESVRLAGDPRGLASALYKMREYSRYLARYLRRFQFIYTVDLEQGPAWLRTHPSTEDRVAKLLTHEGSTTYRTLETAENRPALPRRRSGVVHIPIRYVA